MKIWIAIIVWILITIFINYQIAYNSTYKSDAPDIKFWNKLPFTALICGVIIFGIYGIYAISKNKDKK